MLAGWRGRREAMRRRLTMAVLAAAVAVVCMLAVMVRSRKRPVATPAGA